MGRGEAVRAETHADGFRAIPLRFMAFYPSYGGLCQRRQFSFWVEKRLSHRAKYP